MSRPLNQIEKAQLRAMIARTSLEVVAKASGMLVRVYVRGGLVEDVMTTGPRVEVLDYDVEGTSDPECLSEDTNGESCIISIYNR